MAWRVIGRLESGQTQRSVTDAVGVARSVVARLWNRFQETGNVRRRPGAGRPRTTTSTNDRVTPDVFLYGGTGALEITPHSFVKGHNTEELVGWYGGGISIGGRTDLHIIRNGTLTGRRYADEILRPHVIPYAGAIRDSFVFQDDNGRPHRARLVENMLEAETIQRMEWPACSPDLNPIEHVWDILGRRIAARPRPPATVRDLEIALLEEWNSIPQSLIDNLIASRENRCAAVLAVRGDHTPY
ncbi:transposable element Tcb2 transposase [Trichonephila clavipes]|nr:transposable element Tcb2 transposase [Trichonephila clavipes]